MLLRIVSAVAIMSLFSIVSDVHAQTLFGGGGTGQTGGRTTTGGQSTSATGGLTSGGATGGNVGGGTGTGGARSGATAGSGGLTESRAGTLSVSDGSLTSNVGQGNFAGFQTGGAFVGGNFAGTQTQTNSRAQFSSLQNRGGGAGQANRGNQSRSINNRTPVRPQFQVAFTAPTVPAQKIENSLSASVLKLPQLSYTNESITLSVNEAGVVTMAGQVNSDREKKLLEAFVRMEPGVRKVENELTIADSVN